MRRIALWVPDWPVNSLAADLEAGEPGAVVASGRVEAATAAARSRGVRVGMRTRAASSLCPELVCLPRDEEREGRAFEAVLSAFDQVAAGVECLRPGLAWANATGPARWAGGEEVAARGLVEAVEERVGVECFAGIAEGPLGAVCAARQGRIVPAGGTARFLSAVPLGPVVAGLAPPGLRDRVEEAVALLRRLGIRVCADLLGMGATAVSSRFGVAGEFLWRAASGGELALAGALRPLGDIGTGVDIDEGGENIDAVLVPALRCAHDLADRLARRGLLADALLVEASAGGGGELTRRWRGVDLMSPDEIAERVRWNLLGWTEGAARPEGPIRSLRLTAVEPYPADALTPLWGADARQRGIERLAARLQGLAGEGAVSRPQLRGGYDPRSRAVLVPWGAPSAHARGGDWEGGVEEPPAALYDQPRPVLLLGADPGRAPIGVTARGLLSAEPARLVLDPQGRARTVPVRPLAGPWAVAGRWWDAEGSARAYLRVALEGEGGGAEDLLLVFRAGAWSVEGAYA
ncbi:DNA polymerase Y family protein [Schaalia georgiae]|nr:DNA polymerase Y family protein [Schaalia georgiae]